MTDRGQDGAPPVAASLPSPERLAQVSAALREVRLRISAAAGAVGRDPADITLIAVTKTFPAADVAALADLGVRDVGENRDQEAVTKRRELAAPPFPPVELRWHLVGQLQTNKARSVAGYAAAVHSVDRTKLVTALAAAVDQAGRSPLDVFVQVSLDGDATRGGADPAQVSGLAAAVAARAGLQLRGVMAVAPRGMEPVRAFAALAEISEQLRAQHPGAGAISAGMSADLEAAVRHGATHVRVGSALLGRRPPDLG